MAPILLTSFRPWKVHQRENSSEMLVRRARSRLPSDTLWLSDLVVNFELAPIQVIAQIQQHHPRLVICCGMAERRDVLTLEQWGKGERSLQTRLDLKSLTADTVNTHISQDAGRYVCNHLYYRVLDYLQQHRPQTPALFVHVPVPTVHTWPVVEFDFLRLVHRLDRETLPCGEY